MLAAQWHTSGGSTFPAAKIGGMLLPTMLLPTMLLPTMLSDLKQDTTYCQHEACVAEVNSILPLAAIFLEFIKGLSPAIT